MNVLFVVVIHEYSLQDMCLCVYCKRKGECVCVNVSRYAVAYIVGTEQEGFVTRDLYVCICVSVCIYLAFLGIKKRLSRGYQEYSQCQSVNVLARQSMPTFFFHYFEFLFGFN